MHLFLNVSVKEISNFMRKYYLIAESLIFKYRWQNISVSNTALLTAVTCLEVTLCCENPFDVLAISEGVRCCEQSGKYQLVLCWSRYKGDGQYYWDVLLHQQLSTSHLRSVMATTTLLPKGAWDHAAANLWNTRLHRSSSVASQQSWPEPSRLPDLGEAAVVRVWCVSQLDSWHWPAEVMPVQRVGTITPGVHRWSYQAWCPRFWVCVRAHWGHFGHRL